MSELIECLDGLRAEDILRRIAKTANGQPFYLQTFGLGGGFCAEYQTIYNAFTTPPDEATADAQNTFVCGLVEDGIWTKLDILYVLAMGTAADAVLNWKTPGSFTIMPVNNPLFTVWEGYTGANLKYLNTNWKANPNAINYAQNNASCGYYIRNNLQADGWFGVFDASTRRAAIRFRSTTNTSALYFNSLLQDSGSNSDSRGMFICNRTGANDQDIYKNGIRIVDGSDASNGVPDLDWYLLCLNSAGVAANYMSYQLSFFFTGSSLTTGDITNITNGFEIYMDFLGKGVIP